MAKPRKTTTKRKRTTPVRSRSQSVRSLRRNAASQRFNRLAIPLALSLCLLIGIGFIGLLGYKSATASSFFKVRSVEVNGVERSQSDDIRRIVTSGAEPTGVWHADLAEIRAKIEKLPFVKTAAVSMALPAGIRVNVVERVPVAIVKLAGGDYLVDSEGVVLAPAAKIEASIPFVLRGWDESKTDKANPDNLARLKLYKKMLDEWKGIGIADRVREVNLADLRDPAAVIEDTGRTIAITVAKDNLAKSLKSAIEAVAGKGEKIRSVNSGGVYPVIEYMGN
ncbi:MAG TPA: FtsQ-type POTRA domain-containing protein [Pyrinomonadaceae bacterium]|nr:FtsQ-type POTRA domain-containing protein [Pyrinomonadaceae bacterium]